MLNHVSLGYFLQAVLPNGLGELRLHQATHPYDDALIHNYALQFLSTAERALRILDRRDTEQN